MRTLVLVMVSLHYRIKVTQTSNSPTEKLLIYLGTTCRYWPEVNLSLHCSDFNVKKSRGAGTSLNLTRHLLPFWQQNNIPVVLVSGLVTIHCPASSPPTHQYYPQHPAFLRSQKKSQSRHENVWTRPDFGQAT